jgi:hypothetical protein
MAALRTVNQRSMAWALATPSRLARQRWVELTPADRHLRAALAAVLVRDNAPGAARPSRRRSCWATLAAVSLLTELDGFYTEHRRCGELDADVDGQIVWLACYSGARMARRVDEVDDAADLALNARGPPSVPGGCT